jgi:hypothetical protein|tara:strand:+ start:932 stop:1186 length:255 start_codon:yes stop_codon:yes gene_type:complete
LRQHRENESTLKQLRREIATLQIEKNKDLQKHKDSFETSMQSKSQSYESQIHSLKLELAQNIGTLKDQDSKLKMALEASAKLEK